MRKILLILSMLMLPLSAVWPAPVDDGEAVAQPKLLQQGMRHINAIQQDIKQTMTGYVRDFKSGERPGALLLIFALAFAYGAVHAAGPGHGKTVVLAYLLNRSDGYVRGILLGALAAFFHGVNAIAIMLAIYLFSLGRLTTGFDAASQRLMLVSSGMIVLIGLVLLARWFNGPGDAARRSRIPVIVSIGLVPCPGTMIVLLFFMSLRLLGLGIAVALIMSLGMALTVALIAVLGVGGRRLVVNAGGNRAGRAVELAGALLVLGLGVIMLAARIMS